jgi:hypothetical protein
VIPLRDLMRKHLDGKKKRKEEKKSFSPPERKEDRRGLQ